MSTVENLSGWKNDEYVYEQLNAARELMSNKNTTKAQFDGVRQCLGFMFLYCNDHVRSLVESTLQELFMREIMFEKIWDKEE